MRSCILNRLNYKKFLLIAAFYIGTLILWQASYEVFAVRLGIVKKYIFPNPAGIVNTYGKLMGNNLLLGAVLSSMQKMLAGFGLSILIGVIIGIVIIRIKFIADAVKPLILGLQTLPSICWVPFAILWFGLADDATIFVIVVGSAFSVALAVESAILSVNPLYIKAAQTMGTSKVNIYLKVILPASTPELISGLKQGWSFAWRALMAGEIIAVTGKAGLGYILLVGREIQDINQVAAIMILIVAISVFFEKLFFGKIERYTRKKMGQI